MTNLVVPRNKPGPLGLPNCNVAHHNESGHGWSLPHDGARSPRGMPMPSVDQDEHALPPRSANYRARQSIHHAPAALVERAPFPSCAATKQSHWRNHAL